MKVYHCSDEHYRWGVSTPAGDADRILLSVSNDYCPMQNSRIRLSPEDARDLANTLLAHAQDIELCTT